MGQKIIWMPLLLIGMLSSFQFCDKGEVDKVYRQEYYLINKSGEDVILDAFYLQGDNDYKYSYSIDMDSTLFQRIDLFSGSRTSVAVFADSVAITFGSNSDVRFIASDTISPYNVLNLANYEVITVSDHLSKFIYTFSNDDYNNAVPINAE